MFATRVAIASLDRLRHLMLFSVTPKEPSALIGNSALKDFLYVVADDDDDDGTF